MVTAAVIGSAVVSAAGTAYAGSEAAGATKAASNAAIAEQNAALQQQAALSAPYRQFGESAIPTLQGLLGLTGPGGPAGAGGAASSGLGGPTGQGYDPATGYSVGLGGTIGRNLTLAGGPTAAPPAAPMGGGLPPAGPTLAANDPTSILRNTPGYQFIQEQGTKGAINAATAQGLSLSGNTLQALSNYNQGLADTTYQQTIGNLENAVGVGQAAAAGQAANIGNAASNISNTLYGQGQTQAGIDVNTAAGLTKSIGNAANQYTQYQTLQGLNNPGSEEIFSGQFGGNPSGAGAAIDPATGTDYSAWSDRRLKTDIQRVGTLPSGIPVYRFRYLFDGPEVIRTGVIADEVEPVFPDAVTTRGGFKRVDYQRIH